MTTTTTIFHVTRIATDAYGHDASTCDASGCAGFERRLTLADPASVDVGGVFEIDETTGRIVCSTRNGRPLGNPIANKCAACCKVGHEPTAFDSFADRDDLAPPAIGVALEWTDNEWLCAECRAELDPSDDE